MIKIRFLILLSASLYTLNSNALSPDAVEGKKLYPTCLACHNQAQEPSMGPPMWGVQRRYKKATDSDEEFIKRMASFVKAPTLESAIHEQALSELGLMPPMPLPDEALKNIATYVLEEQFPPPCDHWRNAIKRAKDKGDLDHAKKDQSQLKRFCN